MGVCGALVEERITDEQTGRTLNPDMEFYKLAGIGDVGEIVSHIEVIPEADKRGVIGHSEDETESLLGKPVRVVEQASAKIWRYQGDDCAVDVTFFFDVSRGRFFALDVTPVTGELNRCLAKLEGHIAS